MALLEQILQENARFTAELPESYIHRNDKVSKYPAKQLAIYTCMDTRLVDFWNLPWAYRAAKQRLLKQQAI